MADDNIYDSEEDEDYKPDVEKPVKKLGQQKKKNDYKADLEKPVKELSQQTPRGIESKKAKINAIWEQLNAKDAEFSSKAARGAAAHSSAGPPSRSTGATPGWMKNLGMVPKKPGYEVRPPSAENGAKEPIVDTNGSKADIKSDQTVKAEAIRKEEARKIASAALAAAKVAAKTITDGKVEINEVRDFAGEEVRVTKYVDPNSKAAVTARRKAEGTSSSGLDALLEQIGKKQKLNILDKSRKDWGEFKEDTGIETELESHIKSGDKYTDKVAFLQRSDFREYERERDARLAMMSKRRSESAPVD